MDEVYLGGELDAGSAMRIVITLFSCLVLSIVLGVLGMWLLVGACVLIGVAVIGHELYFTRVWRYRFTKTEVVVRQLFAEKTISYQGLNAVMWRGALRGRARRNRDRVLLLLKRGNKVELEITRRYVAKRPQLMALLQSVDMPIQYF